MVGLPVVGTVLLFARMALGPINVTPLVRPFLPVAVISGGKKQPPVATLGLRRAYLEWNGLRDGFTSPLMLALHDIAVKGPDRSLHRLPVPSYGQFTGRLTFLLPTGAKPPMQPS